MPAMQKIMLLFSIILSGLIFSAGGEAAYVIHLKNGGQFWTTHHWEEKQEVRFYVAGGVMGIEKDRVRKIEKSIVDGDDVADVRVPEKRPAEAQTKPEKTLIPQSPGEKIDLKAYQAKMAGLKTALSKTLTRIRKATAEKDLDAKREATEENRRISASIYQLTDELKERNNGLLPADWWKGLGREEPAGR